MGQLTLTYTPETEGRAAWDAQLDILRSAVAHLVPKDVADQLNINRSTLSEALNPPSRSRQEEDEKKGPPLRRWAAEWTHIVKAMLAKRRSDEVAVDLLRRLCEADVGVTWFEVVEPLDLSPEERAVLTRAMDKMQRARARAA